MTTIPGAHHRYSLADVAAFPKPLVWRHLLKMSALPQRPLRLALPCVGIDGCTHACAELGIPFQAVNVFDVEPGVQEPLSHHHGRQVAEQFHLGPVDGDVTKVAIKDLQLPVDGLCAGPPCPPWAGNGRKECESDQRAAVFKTVLGWVLHFIKTGGLIFTVLENVKGISQKIGGQTSFMEKTLEDLRDTCPEFVWDVFTLSARDYLLRQEITRVFLVGVRRAFVPTVPRPAPAFGRTALEQCLNSRLPCTSLDSLTMHMKKNMLDYGEQIARDVADGKLARDSVVACCADRAKGKVFRQTYTVGAVPTLTTSNKYLFLVNVAEVMDKVPMAQRTLFRWVHPLERLCFQGFNPDIGAHMPAKLIYKTTGNAYPVNLLAAILAPIVGEISRTGMLTRWVCGPIAKVRLAEARLRGSYKRGGVHEREGRLVRHKPACGEQAATRDSDSSDSE